MKNLVYFLERFQRRTLLIAAAVLLSIIVLWRWVDDQYATRQEEVNSRLVQLGQYQLIASEAKSLEKRHNSLLRVKEQAGRYFFAGEDDDKISSAMQLRVQAMVARSGLQAESIRSTLQKIDAVKNSGGEGNDLGGVLVKARLAGTLSELMSFLELLYKGREFFAIQSISLKPYRDTGLKIFVELKGYYVLHGQDSNSGEDKS